MGQNREPSKPDGQHGGEWQDPSSRRDLPYLEGPGLCLWLPRRDLCQRHQWTGRKNKNILSPGKSPAQPIYHAPKKTTWAVLLGCSCPGPCAVPQQATAEAVTQWEQQHRDHQRSLQPADFVDTQWVRTWSPSWRHWQVRFAIRSILFTFLFFLYFFYI